MLFHWPNTILIDTVHVFSYVKERNKLKGTEAALLELSTVQGALPSKNDWLAANSVNWLLWVTMCLSPS